MTLIVNQLFPTPLTSPRLLLRRLESGDAPSVCAYRSLPEVALFQSWDSFGPEDAARLIETQRDLEPGVPGTWFQVAIVDRATGAVVGDCGLHCLQEEPRQMELGITLAPSHQGRGYAAEALCALLSFVFGSLKMHRVAAVTGAANVSAAALFRRLGFRQEAHLIEHRWYKGAWESEYGFAILGRDWEALAPGRRS